MVSIKSFVKRILSSLNGKVYNETPFQTSERYWKDRYQKGGNSGHGSYNKLAEFKGEIINSFVQEREIKTVVEFGCGDGNQLKYFNFHSYIGYDISPVAIKKCSKIFQADKSKEFRLMKDYSNKSADLAMSLDVIYHLIEDQVYHEYLSRLFSHSHNYIIIYSSNSDDNENSGPHVKHRKFTQWVELNNPDFKLIKHVQNKYSFTGDWATSSLADFFIFENEKKKNP